jgi:outer membrane protein
MTTIVRRSAVCAILSALSFTALAQTASDPHALTLDDAVRLALEHNLDIVVQRVVPPAYDLSLAVLQATYRPALTSQIGTQTSVTPSSSTISGATAAAGITSGVSTYNAGITQNIGWGGGGYTVTLNNNRQTTSSSTTLFNPAYNTSYSLQYTQPLLRGFSIDSTRQQLLVTKVNRDISELQIRSTIVNTVASVRKAYWDYVYAIEAVDVARESLRLAQRLVTDNQKRVQIGTMAPIEIVQARSQAATQQQAVVQAEATRDQAEIALKRLIVGSTTDPNWSATLDPVDRPSFATDAIDVAEAVRRGLASRTDLATAKKTVEENDITLRYLKNQLLPQVDLSARYGLVGIGGTQFQRSGTGITGDVVSTIPGSYADALTSLLGSNYPSWSVAINISYPLGKTAAEASVARARLRTQETAAQVRQIELQIASEVTNAAKAAQSAAQGVQAAQVSRDLAQQTLDAEQKKFQVGMSTNFNIIQAQRDLAAARNAELQAVLAYRKAIVELDRLQQATSQPVSLTTISASSSTGGTENH